MNHLDTFSGIGGWALAAKWMGWNTLAFVERDKYCQKVLAKNFPGTPIYGDIFDFSGKPFRGRVDILTGSTPCQPFSAAGKRQGSNDDRHLFPEFLRLVREIEPEWVCIENVFGLLNIESGNVFEAYCSSLEGEGYSVETVCIPASAVNAPHRRDRLWFVAHANGLRERAGHREVQGTNGEVPERHDDAESCYADNEPVNDALNSEHRADRRAIRETGSISEINRPAVRSGRSGGTGGDAANRNGKGLQGSNKGTYRTRQPETVFRLRDRNGWGESWLDVAARTCVRGVDDGISAELDIVGARDNRVSRLKALGNAVVPALVFEIFKAIEAAEESRNAR